MSGAASVFARFILIPIFGWGAVKCGIVGNKGQNLIRFLLLNICYPLMILANIWQMNFGLFWAQSAVTVIYCTALSSILYVSGSFYFRRASIRNPALWNFMFGIGNVAYIGIPLLQVFFGRSAATLAIVYSSVSDLFIWLFYYPAVLKGKRKPLREVLCNPCLIAIFVSLILSITKTPIPIILAPVMNASPAAVSLAALFYVGTTFAGVKIREIIKDHIAWKFSTIKVIALPAVCFLFLWPLIGASRAIPLAIIAGCPTPLLSLVWSRDNPSNSKDAQRCFIVSTLLFLMVMIPLCMIVT